MLASLLTRNATVAFIAAGLFCAVLVAAGPAASAVAPGLGRAVEALGVFLHFDDFAKGIVSLSALVYFVSIGAFFLYLNVLVLSRRHWAHSADGYPMGLHHAVRGVAVAAALISAGVLVTNRSVRIDVTAEQLHSLSGETRRLLDELPADRPVFIQAFISPDVPEPFVQTRSNLISILEEIDVLAGPRVEVLIQDTEPFTDAAREARETFGIQPRPVRNVSTARSEVEEVFLGVAFTSGAEEQVIGFFDVGLPAEYELMRSIRVVAGTERKRVGVVATMANLFGGTNFQRNQFTPQWSVVTELRKQYDVVEISPEMAIGQDVDALLVPLPSSLQTDEQGFVADYIRSGKPALILVDPLPAVNPTLSPSEWVGDGNPFTYPPGQPRPGPRGNVREWIRNLGVDWEPTRIVWDSYNPHPELAHMPEDVIFLGAGNENPATFNADDPMTAQLQELVLLFPGFLQAVADPRFEFRPLLRSGMVSGANGYFSLVRGTPFGPQVNPSPPRRQDDDDYIVAARIRSVGGDAAADASENADDAGAADEAAAEEAGEPAAGTADEADSGAAGGEPTIAEEAVAEPEAGTDVAESPEAAAAPAEEPSPAGEPGTEPDSGAEEAESTEPAAPTAEETEAEPGAESAEPPATERDEAAGDEQEEPEAAESTETTAGASASETAASSASQTAESDEPPESRPEPVESAETAAEAQEPSAAEAPAAESGEERATESPVAETAAEAQEPSAAESPAAAQEAAPGAEAAAESESAVDDTEAVAESEPVAAESPEAAAAEPAAETDSVEPAEPESDSAESDTAAEPEPTGDIDIIVVADLDFISEQFFQIREQAPGGLNFDNITFFLNAMDTLLGEDAFIDLRSRRARHRTLERVEAQTAEFIEQRTAEEQQAEADAEEALTEAQQRLNDRVAELQGRNDIDAQTRQIMVRNLEEVENRRLEVLSANIETEK
ncbi:MAG: Gldg family protein, partial [Acidobacteria bacterium]|nr:Gldg family protein [Acidobacteriota bacterium]